MGSSRVGVRTFFLIGAFVQLLCHELALGVGPCERLPTHLRRQAQPESKDILGDALEECSHELLVSHKFWSPKDPGGIKGPRRWQSYELAPSIPCIRNHSGSLQTSECGGHSHYLV